MGVFGDDGFMAPPPPCQEEVEAVLVRTVERLLPLPELELTPTGDCGSTPTDVACSCTATNCQ